VTVGFYSPLPPARTGVADYAAALLSGLRKRGTVEIAPARCDSALYHTGNNRLHADIYARALVQPGVVVLHDAVLHHFLLGYLDERAYIEEFAYNYGEWNRGMAEELWKGRGVSGADERYFRYPMLRRLVERSSAVIVHNPAAARAVREHAAAARVVEIPHLFAPPRLPAFPDVERFRQGLGFAPGTFLFGVFGYLRESKRLTSVLAAFERLHKERQDTGLLIAGEFVSRDLSRALDRVNATPSVVRLPYLEEHEFWLAASSVDACVNLRYPAAGETSGIAIRLMGIGKPVLLSRGEENSRYPEDACIRVETGAAERESLWQHMVLLTSIKEAAGAIGQRGAEHIQAHHRVGLAATAYWKLLCERGP
jgi:glycosyltransferase involved in cell wall biosynthesis